jgi:predicted nucleic acid-binding protein
VAVAGWIVDKSASASANVAGIRKELDLLAGSLFICPVGRLEQLYSARSAQDYDALDESMSARLPTVEAPADIFERALRLQRDLAHHHGMWHRTPIPDLLIAEIALHHGLGIVHIDRDFDRIAEVRPLTVRRLTL